MVKKKDGDEEKTPAIDKVIADLAKKYGEGTVMHGEDYPLNIEALPTGCFALDKVLGCGGLPRGRIIELYGEPSSGKTATTLFLIAQMQKEGRRCVFIDAEHAFDNTFASTIGVDVKKLYISQPTDLEEAMVTVRDFVNTNEIDLIVVDSVPALTPRSEIEADDMLKDTVAVRAKLMSKALTVLTGEVSRSKTVVIFINHLKDKINMGWGSQYGEKTTTPGGKALKFYSSVRIAVSKGEKLPKGTKDVQLGNKVTVKAVKNKCAPPYGEATYDLYYATGVDLIADLFDAAVENEVVTQTGNTFMFGETKLGVGRDATIEAMRLTDNHAIEDTLKQKLTSIKEQ